MSTQQVPLFSTVAIARQRRINRFLAMAPRMGVIGTVRRTFVRTVLAVSARGSTRRTQAKGLIVERHELTDEGQTVRLRVIRRPVPAMAIVLDIHGGAWAFGSAAMDDDLNAELALRLNAIVVSVDYQLALPRPIAALQQECATAVKWLLSGRHSLGADLPIAITGESAGAHLAVSALLRARDDGVSLTRICGMLLHYGAYDLAGSPSALAAGRETLLLHGPSLQRQIELLLPGTTQEMRRNPSISPAYADCSGLPPALLMAGDLDPLRDDTTVMAATLRASGVSATEIRLPETPHGVIHMRGPLARQVRETGIRWLSERLALSDDRQERLEMAGHR